MSSNPSVDALIASRIAKKKQSEKEESAQAKTNSTAQSEEEQMLHQAKDGDYMEEEEVEEVDGDEEAEDIEESLASSSRSKSSSSSAASNLRSYLETEDDNEWSTERDEAAEAAAHASALELDNGNKKKKRRLTKLADADQLQALQHGRGEDEYDDDDGFIVDDLGGGMFDRDDDFGVKRDKKLMESIQLQKPFQPASTPQEQGNRRRFLAYNSIGSISSTEMNSDHTADVKVHIVELVYSDSSKLKSSKFRDFFNFKVAALGAHGAVFASEIGWDKQDKKEIPSTLFFRPTETWDAQASSEWQLQMDIQAKEEAQLVAIGDTWVAVYTNKQYVRIISHSGIQKFILSLTGPAVSIVGHGHQLAIVYHDGIPLPGHQNLGLLVMDIVKKKEIYRGKCAISPRSKLTWIGFSDIGMLLCMDSFGVIRSLARSWNFHWTPILDTNLLKKAGSTDIYWPIGLIDDKLMCVICKGGARYPSVQPRPTLQSISMQLPFLDLLNQNRVALAEENHARCELLWYNDELGGMATASKYFTSKQETVQDKTIIGLFQKACALDRHSRALDLCTMMHKKKALEIAIQIATHAKKTALVSRISMLMQVKFPTVDPKHDLEDEGLSSLFNGSSQTVGSKRGTLRRPAVSFEEAEEENKRGNEDGEEELEFGTAMKGNQTINQKRKLDELQSTPSTALASLTASSSLNSKVFTSANVKPKLLSTSTPSTQNGTSTSNPFARKA